MSQEQPINTSSYVHPRDPHLHRIENAMVYNANGEPVLRTVVEGVTIEGDVVVDRVKLWDGTNNLLFDTTVNDGEASPTVVLPTENHNMVFNGSTWDRMRGTIADGVLTQISNDYLAISKDTNANSESNRIFVNASGTVTANVTFPDIQKISKDANANSTTNPIYVNVTNTEVEIKNDLNNPIPISKNLLPNSSANPINVNLIGSGEASGISSSIDSKGRLKVQTQQTIFFNTFQYGKETDVWDESAVNGASATFDTSFSQVRMQVTNQLGSKVIRQTRNVQRYTPGRTQSVAFAVRLETPATGIRRRFGMFDGNDGFFFEDCGTVDPVTGDPQYACVVINSDGATPTVERIYRKDWNGDKLDGTGPSGITADPQAQQLIMMDYEWYGAGQVSFMFVINGLPRVIHTFNHGNRLQSPWAKTPFLPIRLEIENLTGAAGTHYLWQGSNSILAEGTVEKLGIAESILTPLTGINMQLANTFYPVLSIRIKSTALTGIVLPTYFQAGTVDNTDIYFKLIRNATVNGTWVNHPDPNAFTQYNYTSTGAITDGVDLASGLITASGGASQIRVDSDTVYQLGRGSLGTVSDTLTLAIAAKNANKNAVASMTWIEQR